jgi:hypothetical protein
MMADAGHELIVNLITGEIIDADHHMLAELKMPPGFKLIEDISPDQLTALVRKLYDRIVQLEARIENARHDTRPSYGASGDADWDAE